MRKIQCNFIDEIHFHDQLQTENNNIAIHARSRARLRVFEPVSIGLNVTDVGAKSQLRGRVIRRKPAALAQQHDDPAWEYTIHLDAEDKVWFEAFVNDLKMRSQFKSPRMSA